jgi:hypothetical protein
MTDPYAEGANEDMIVPFWLAKEKGATVCRP